MGDAPRAARGPHWPLLALGAAQLVLLLLAYSNHFANSFHFDDSHSIVQNVWIRELRNVPRFFTDATTFSSLPANQSYRPLLLLSYALDYRLGGGLSPVQFHLTSFAFLLCQCAAMFFLFARVLEPADRHRLNPFLAFFAAALFSVHTAVAETVNYVSARSDLLSTCLVVLSLAVYAWWPRARRWGGYLFFFVLAALVKPVVLVFPLLVFLYGLMVEPAGAGTDSRGAQRRPWIGAAAAAAPSLLLAAPLAFLHSRMTPSTFSPSDTSRFEYAITQPYVILRYFRRFFLPTDLSADTDLSPFASLGDHRALAGLAFLAAFVVLIGVAARRAATRPIAFGAAWFLITVAPTSSFFPLAEVENDHRLFLPFVGLVLAVVAAAGLLIKRWEPSLARGRLWRTAVVSVAAAVLLLNAWGTHRRNEVWRTEESLWRDVTVKSPANGRGLMNYGLTLMGKGQLDEALRWFERARPLVPNYSYLYVNLGVALAAKGDTAAAEQNFLTGIRLSSNTAEPHFFYARFLKDRGRLAEALSQVQEALEISPAHPDPRHLLLELLAASGNRRALLDAARETLRIWPDDETARACLKAPDAAGEKPGAPHPTTRWVGTPDQLLSQSLQLYQSGRFEDCIAACRAALIVKPDYAEAYNNICAAYNSLHRWDLAIGACEQALYVRPDFELARNNLRWAQTSKSGAKH